MAQENYPLDDLTIGLIADFQRQIATMLGRIEGILFLYSKQHNLTGPWTLAPNGRELQNAGDGGIVAQDSPDFLEKIKENKHA